MTGPDITGTRPRQGLALAAGAGYVVVMAALAAVAAWPIYRSGSFIVLAVIATLVGGAVALIALRRGWGGWTVAAILAGVVLVLGVPLAVPSRLGSPLEIIRGVGDVAVGAVFAWKDLVTVDLPVGTYRNLLVPALIVFLVGTYAALRLAWTEGRAAPASVAVGLGMLSFGLFFGRTTVSAPLVIGPFTLSAPVETAVGVAGIVASLVWLAWHARDERIRALRRASAADGVRLHRRPSRADRNRAALGAGMVAVAVVVAAVVAPAAAQGRDREVLRAAAGPEVALAQTPSPLVGYRALFADDRAEDVLFTVAPGQDAPERIRLATLDVYDGEVYRSGGSGAAGRFVRVPSNLDAGTGRRVEITVEVADLAGIWMPTAGRLAGVAFAGPRAPALAERFYYSADAEAGVQTADGGLRAGDAYTLSAVEPDIPALETIQPPSGAVVVSGDAAPPANLRAWVQEHAAGSGGEALAGLVALLRERGYLSHALTRTSDEPVWAQGLQGYAFQPSAAGHSLSRIDAMFSRLLAREGDPRAAASDDFVAAIGDDEQFSVAVALIAQQLGFPARVVVGTRLSASDPDLTTCAEGACRAQDVAAWAEVRSADGVWVPVDATPQHTVSPSLDLTEQRDPEIVTEVRPDAVTDVVPPDSLQDDSANDDAVAPPSGLDLTWLWPVLRVGAIVALLLLLVAGPIAVVIAAKAVRRRARRTHPDPAVRIAGGWEEYVDAATDAGRGIPPSSTRPEVAAVLATPGAGALAADADDAAFSGRTTTADRSDEYWRRVDAERAALTSGLGFRRRAVAALSLRSFLRFLSPATGDRRGSRPVEPSKERRRRRPTADARPST